MTDNNFAEPLMLVDAAGIHVSSEKVAKALEKKNISPSLVTSLEGCPARWAAETFVIRDLVQEEPDNAARRGTLYHRVMEIFFDEEPEDRTLARMKAVVDEVFKEDDFVDMAEMPEVVKWLREAINNYYRMGAHPENVQIASIPDKKGEMKKGLEVFVKGNIGNAKREVLGFIDQLNVDPRYDDGSVVVVDWKTGAKVKRYKPKNKGTEGLGEARQQKIYAELLENQGISVTGARLIYPMAKEIVNIDLKDESFTKKIISDIEEADKKLDQFVESNTFEYKPDFLCAWCKFAKICPAATIKPYDKMREAYSKQPEAEILTQAGGFELK